MPVHAPERAFMALAERPGNYCLATIHSSTDFPSSWYRSAPARRPAARAAAGCPHGHLLGLPGLLLHSLQVLRHRARYRPIARSAAAWGRARRRKSARAHGAITSQPLFHLRLLLIVLLEEGGSSAHDQL